MLTLASLAVLLAVGVGADEPVPIAASDTVQGMTISCQTWGWEWGTDEMVETMRELKKLGVNWISIHPYAGIRADGSVAMGRTSNHEPQWLTRPIAEAHKLGLKIMIKPHLAYWGSPFKWRGEITFENDQQWQRFFSQYETWISRVAEICADADAFVVGTELDRTVHREKEWRTIIASVRGRFKGPLTYAANWTDYERVPFWDDLDVIGVQAYFPLTDEEGLPELQDLRKSWAEWVSRLNAFGKRHERKVLLAEVGYSCSANAALRPWEARVGGEHAEEVQRRCLTAALAALEAEDRVVGSFLWKWFAGRTRHENFLMSTPAMRDVIREHWGK